MIVHPNLFDYLPLVYHSKCTIQQATEGQDASGHPVKTWSDLAGHIDLPCRKSPFRTTGEVKDVKGIYTRASHIISIGKPLPEVTTKMRAVVDGTVYDILLPEQDGQSASTRLLVEEIT